MIVVSGITGQTGAATARHLLAAGASVTGLTRRPDAALDGVGLATVDLADTPALTAVLQGAKAFYVLLPPQWGAPDMFAAVEPIVRSVVTAIEAADVPRVVVLSSIAAQVPDGTGPIRSVRALEGALATRPGVTFLRPSYFLQNLGSLLEAIHAGQLPTYWDPAMSMPVIDTEDIGAVAAEQLLAEDGPRVLQVTGPRDVAFAEVAQTFGQVLDRAVEPLVLPPEAITPQLEAMGAGHLATLYAEMNRGILEGTIAFDDALPVRRTATPLRDSLRRIVAT
jgi:uncharacterized protein YbjT (DUF2867 family)